MNDNKDLYITPQGEIRTKEYWTNWIQRSLVSVYHGAPVHMTKEHKGTDYFSRAVKLMKLEPLGDYSGIPEANLNLIREQTL